MRLFIIVFLSISFFPSLSHALSPDACNMQNAILEPKLAIFTCQHVSKDQRVSAKRRSNALYFRATACSMMMTQSIRASKARACFHQVIADCTKAIAIDPTNHQCYSLRGSFFSDSGKFPEAIADLDMAIKLAPNVQLYHYERAETYERMKQYDKAVADFTAAIQLKTPPGDLDLLLYIGRAKVHMRRQAYDNAIEDYSEAMKIDPNTSFLLDRRGAAKRLKGDIDGAIADHTATIKLEPTKMLHFLYRAYAYEIGGHRAKAIADYQEALRLKPGHEFALERLAELTGTQ